MARYGPYPGGGAPPLGHGDDIESRVFELERKLLLQTNVIDAQIPLALSQRVARLEESQRTRIGALEDRNAALETQRDEFLAKFAALEAMQEAMAEQISNLQGHDTGSQSSPVQKVPRLATADLTAASGGALEAMDAVRQARSLLDDVSANFDTAGIQKQIDKLQRTVDWLRWDLKDYWGPTLGWLYNTHKLSIEHWSGDRGHGHGSSSGSAWLGGHHGDATMVQPSTD